MSKQIYLQQQTEILRRIASNGLKTAVEAQEDVYVDYFQHLQDEIERVQAVLEEDIFK